MKRSASDFVRSLKWGDGTRKPYTGNPYVRFDEGTEDQRPPPTLFILPSFEAAVEILFEI